MNIQGLPENGILEEGQELTLFCAVNTPSSDDIQYAWFYNSPGAKDSVQLATEPVLMVDNVKEENSGVYTCNVNVGDNVFTAASGSVTIEVWE